MSKYAFGDIAINSTEKKKPESADKAMYIGLEHLDSGCLTVRRFGADVAPIGDKLVMKKGDVLFGKRRAYQKKVAIAPFDGIFSAHGMVLRPKTAVIDKGFFPLFIASDYFLDAAIKISVGSLSPTINWSDLKRLEFSLPPLDEQKKLAQVLWSAIELKEAYQVMLARCDEMASSRFIEMFGDPVENPKKWATCPLSTLGTFKNGMNFSSNERGIEIRCLGVGDFKNLSIINTPTKLPIISLAFTPSAEYLLQDGDIIFVRSNGNKALVGRCVAIYTHGLPVTFSGFCIRFRVGSDAVNIMYLLRVLKADTIRKKMAGRGANIQNLNQKILARLAIPIPPLALQNEFAAFIEQLDKSKVELQKSIASTSAMIKSLLSEAMGE